MQTACGHFYCRTCMQDLGHPVMSCLQDKTKLQSNEIFPDNFMRREIRSFVFQCPFQEQGCEWKGEIRDVDSHCSSCDFVTFPCIHEACGMLVMKGDLPDHLQSECKCRPVVCEFCDNYISLDKFDVHLKKDCHKYPVACDKCNKNNIPRSKLSDH